MKKSKLIEKLLALGDMFEYRYEEQIDKIDRQLLRSWISDCDTLSQLIRIVSRYPKGIYSNPRDFGFNADIIYWYPKSETSLRKECLKKIKRFMTKEDFKVASKYLKK